MIKEGVSKVACPFFYAFAVCEKRVNKKVIFLWKK